jgi:hypothetical protein
MSPQEVIPERYVTRSTSANQFAVDADSATTQQAATQQSQPSASTRVVPSTNPRGRILPEGAFILPADMDRIVAGLSDLKWSQNAHASIPVRVNLHLHHEYPKHVTFEDKTAVVNNAQQEENFLKDGTLPLASATPISGFPAKTAPGDDAAKKDQALAGVQSLIDALAASRRENDLLRSELAQSNAEGEVLPSALPSADDLDAQAAENDAAAATSGTGTIETKHYSDGSSATGLAPLPAQSPAQQAAAGSAPVAVTTVGDVQIPVFVTNAPAKPAAKNEPGAYLTPEDQGAVTKTGKYIEPSVSPFATPAALAQQPAPAQAKVVSVATAQATETATDTDDDTTKS